MPKQGRNTGDLGWRLRVGIWLWCRSAGIKTDIWRQVQGLSPQGVGSF